MRKYFYLLFFLLIGFTANAQGNSALAAFNLWQNEVIQLGMLVLGGWAIVNIIIGSFRLTKATRNKKFFYQMNLYWNIVNLCIASATLYFILSVDTTIWQLLESIRMHELYKKILYLSVGLDFACIMIGAYLKERSRNTSKTEQQLGWGQAVTLQGFFLLLLDIIMTILLEVNANQIFGLIP
ncbi:DUF6992 family protein [Pontibacter silvestris]|uniref:DUF6992 family protein n=1 Tax=Pontibacter silvestris TaxID=2305183 RepID=A0ABW4WW08_9BACT|nr:hypothetical protein [Pontibacter silvestris]MCC9138757.1 hypothetical protein [Pontibacter silvestris]